MSKQVVELAITGMPKLIWEMRHEFAEVVREFAKDEEPRVADRLREIATAFEVGQS